MREPEQTDAPLLDARRVGATYDGALAAAPRSVLEGVSLTLARGEIVTVLGPNGAGKSTLLKVLAGALAPAAGEVRAFGRPLASYAREALAKRIAVVHQSEQVAFAFTVREVVAMGRAPHQGRLMRASAEDDAVVEDALVRCDLRALADRPAQALSGGEQKRVAIARALAQRPEVLLLDEPAAFLDVGHALALYDLLADVTAEGRLACLVVMHDLNIATQYASRVVLMKAGRIVAAGPIDQVMTYANLRETYDTDLYAGQNDLTGARFFLPMRTKR